MSSLLLLMEPEPFRPDPFRAEWVILLFLILFAVLAWVRSSYPVRFQMVAESVSTPRYIRQVIRDESALKHPASWGLLFVFFLSGSLFFHQCAMHFSWDFLPGEGWKGHGVILLILAGAVFLKFLSIRLLRLLVGSELGFHDQEFHLLLILQGTGFVLIPLTLFIAFFQPLSPAWGFGAAFLLLGFAFLLYLGRVVQIAVQRGIPPFYIFLYLCALEFLPLIVVTKAFIDHN